jgi:putative GTP pyrophosphokinase
MSERSINWDERLLPYAQAVNELVVKFNSLAAGFSTLGLVSPIEGVSGRVKSVSSILSKARRKGIQLDRLEELMEDVAGIRIICRFVDDINRVSDLIAERDGQDMEVVKVRDYVKNMKQSGYRSFHIIIRYPVVTALGKRFVFAEIQIRTLAMNFWATVEHSLRYKYEKQIPDELQKRLFKSADAAYMMDREISEIRDEIISAEQTSLQLANITDDIIRNIQNLYRVANLEEIEAINRRFLSLYDEGNREKLVELRRQVKVMAEMYNVEVVRKATRA